jgi:hypothetical protein
MIDIEMGGLGREVARYNASCLRQIADVETVLTAEGEASEPTVNPAEAGGVRKLARIG